MCWSKIDISAKTKKDVLSGFTPMLSMSDNYGEGFINSSFQFAFY